MHDVADSVLNSKWGELGRVCLLLVTTSNNECALLLEGAVGWACTGGLAGSGFPRGGGCHYNVAEMSGDHITMVLLREGEGAL